MVRPHMVFYVSCIFHRNFFDIKLKQVYNSNSYHKPVFATENRIFLPHAFIPFEGTKTRA